MSLLLTGGAVFLDGTFQTADVAIDQGRIVSVSPSLPRDGFSVIELHNRLLVPGFVDVHVHLREPYYCSSSFQSFTGSMAVNSGVEHADAARAEQAVLKELADLCDGPK